MLGEDAINSVAGGIEKLLQIMLEILRIMNQLERNSGYEKSGDEKEKQPKIRFGEMKKGEYLNMLKSGEKMGIVTIDKGQLEILKKYSKELGAKYFLLEGSGRQAVAAIPESSREQFENALKMAVKHQLSKEPSALAVKDGSSLIPEKDIDAVKSVLAGYGIPAYTFKTDNGYMNIVPSEYDGQYSKAMENDVPALIEKMAATDITVFEQEIPLDEMLRGDKTISFFSEEQAEYVKAAFPNDDIKLSKDENGEITALYSNELTDKISQCLENFKNDTKAAEAYLVTIVDSQITVNVDKLLVSQNENEYFTRIPGTHGQEYIKLAKDNSRLIDGGKTITSKLDFDKVYSVYDADGIEKSQQTGRKLAEKYNTKSKNGNDKTQIMHFNDGIERIELYNSKDNKLLSFGIQSAEEIRRELINQGFAPYAAEKMLKDIEKVLPQEYKERFGYSDKKSEVTYEAVSSALTAQYKLAEKIRTCEMIKDASKGSKKKICVIDKNTNKYILTSGNENKLHKALEALSFDKAHINAVTAEVQKSYSKSGATLERENVQVHDIDISNAELAPCKYFSDDKGITIIKTEAEKDSIGMKYLEIPKNASRSEVENVVKNQLEIHDIASVAQMMNFIESKGIISASKAAITKDGFEISQPASDIISVSREGISMTMSSDGISSQDIAKKFGISEKDAQKLGTAIRKAVSRNPDGKKTLGQLKDAAFKALEKFNAEKKETAPTAQKTDMSRSK